MSKNQEKSAVQQSKERPRKGCLSEATRSILEAVCNDFQNIGVPDSTDKSGQVSILCDDVEETNEESIIETDAVVSSTASKNTDCEEQVQDQIYSDSEHMVSASTKEQIDQDDDDVSCGVIKLHEKNKENVVQCNSHSSFNVTDASENSHMDIVDDGVCEIIDGSAVALDHINLLTISAEVVEKNATTSLPSSVINEDVPVKSKNVLNPKSGISVSALNSVPSKNHNKLPIITAMTSQPRMGLPITVGDASQRTKHFSQNKHITVGRKAAVLKMSQSSKPAGKVPPLPPRAERFSSTRSTLKARRITAKMKQAWALQLQKDGHLTCPVPGCSQSYVTIANLITHYKWCSGKKSLQHCIYCSSLIIADQDAVLHHIKVEHPEKLEEYKEKLPPKHLIERQEATCKGDLESSQEIPTGKTGLYQTSGNCVAKTLSKKYQRLNKHSKTKLRAKENILKPWKTCLKKKVKVVDEEEPYDKKCVRFNDIVEKIKSVEDKPDEQNTPAPATTVNSANTLFTGILENAFLPEEVDDILDITECEDLPPTNYFDLSDEESVNDPDQPNGSGVITPKKSRCFKVLDTHGFKRFSEYLKLTRDWASERRTYSRSKHGASSDTPTVLQPAATVEDVVDVHQLHDTPEPSKVSLGASETELSQEEITPYCSLPQEEPNKDSPIFDNLVSQLSDREIAKRLSSVDLARSAQPELHATQLPLDRQAESAASKEPQIDVQNSNCTSHTAPVEHVNSVNTGYKSPVTTPKSYRPLIKVRVTCYDNACKEDAIQNAPFGVEKAGSALSKPFGAKSPLTLDKTVASLCKSLQTPPPVPDFDSLIRSCVPATHDSSQPPVTVPKKRGRRPKNFVQCPSDLAKQLPDSALGDGVVTNQVLADNTIQGNTVNPVLVDSAKKTFSIRENGIKLPPGNTVVDGVVVKRKRGRPRKNLAEQFLPPAEGAAKSQVAKTKSLSTSSRKIVHKCKWCADCDSEYTRIIKRKKNSAKGLPRTHIFPGAESLSAEQLAIINTVSSEQIVVSEHLPPAVIKYLKAKKKVLCSKKVKCKESKLHKMARKPGRPRLSHRTKKVDASTQVSQDIDLCGTSVVEQSNAHTEGEKDVNVTNNSFSIVDVLIGSGKGTSDVTQHSIPQSALTSPAATIQMPRKRGRPRKNTLPGIVASPAVMNNSSVATSNLNAHPGVCGDGVVLSTEAREALIKNISPGSISDATTPQLTSPVTPKRGRGRPRKIPLVNKISDLPVAVISNTDIHNTTTVVASSDTNADHEKVINSDSPEKADTCSTVTNLNTCSTVTNLNTCSTVTNLNTCSTVANLNTEEATVSSKQLSNGSQEAVQVCESLEKSSETGTVASSLNVENTESSGVNSVAMDANDTAASAYSAGMGASAAMDANDTAASAYSAGMDTSAAMDANDTAASAYSSEIPNNSVATTVSNIDTSSDVAKVEHEGSKIEESASSVNKETDADNAACQSTSTPVAADCESYAVEEINLSSTVPSTSDENREKVPCEIPTNISDKASPPSASLATCLANQESDIPKSDPSTMEKTAVESNVCRTENLQSAADAVIESVSSTETPHEVPADVSVECASATENSTSYSASTPNDHVEKITSEITVDSGTISSTSELKLSEDTGVAEVLNSKECAVNESLPVTSENKSDESVTEVNSSTDLVGKDSTDVPSESPKTPQKTGKRGRPRKYPPGEKVTPKSSPQSDAPKHRNPNTPEQKTPLRTSSRQRSSRRLCIDDTCMDKCHVGFRTPNLKSNVAEPELLAKSNTKSMQHTESTPRTAKAEILGPDSRDNRSADAAGILTVGKGEEPESMEVRDSQHLISDLCSAVEAEIAKIGDLSNSQKTAEKSDSHELKVPCDTSSDDIKDLGLKRAFVAVSRLPHKAQKISKRRGRKRPRKGIKNVEESLNDPSQKNYAVSTSNMRSSGVESSNSTGNLPVNAAPVGGISRKCSRKGLPRKCVRYAVINSGVDSDTLEDESLGLNTSQEDDKKTRKKARSDKTKIGTPEVVCDKRNGEPSSEPNVVENSVADEHVGKSDVAVEENNKENSIVHSNENEVSSCREQAMSDDKKSKTSKAPAKLKIKGKKRKRNYEESPPQEKESTPKETSAAMSSSDIQNTAKCVEHEAESPPELEQESIRQSARTPPLKKRKLTRRAAVKARKMLVGFINAEKGDATIRETNAENQDHDYVTADRKSGNVSEEILDSDQEEENVATELAKYKEFYFVPKPAIRKVSPELLEEWSLLLSKGKKIACENEGCGRRFKSRVGMRDHYINSVCKRRWQCLKCNKFLNAGPRRMLRHMLSNHSGMKNDRTNETEGGAGKKMFYSTSKKRMLVSDFSAIQWTLAFHKKHSCSDVMPKWKPKKSLWKLQDSKEYEDYLPPLKKSVKIGIECQDKNSEKWFNLNCFESAPVDNESSHCTFFAGGPIWAAAWCPIPFDVEKSEQFVALAAAGEMDSNHKALPATVGKGLIQLWGVGKLEKDMMQCKPTLSLAITHDYGTVWDMSWCPFGCWENPSECTSDEVLPRLGLLAVACSNSSVYIYSIPHPRTLGHGSSSLPVFSTRPSVILQCDSGEPCLATSKSMCTCISWQRTDGCELLAGGFSNGMICVWHLTSESSLLVNSNESLQTTIMPFLSIPAHSAAVTQLTFSGLPGGRWLSSCGFDKVTKIWDLDDTSLPVSTVQRKSVRTVEWLSQWNGLFITKDDTSNATLYKECGYYNYAPRLLIPHNASIWGCSVSEWLNTVVSCDAAGEVVGNVLCDLLKNVDSLKMLHDRRFPVFRTEIRALKDGSVPDHDNAANSREQTPSKCSLQSCVNSCQNSFDVPSVAAGVVMSDAVAVVQTVEDILESVVTQHDSSPEITEDLALCEPNNEIESHHEVSQAKCYSDEMSVDKGSDDLVAEVCEENDPKSHHNDTDVQVVATNVIDQVAFVVQTVEDIVQDVVQRADNSEGIKDAASCISVTAKTSHSSEIPCDDNAAGQPMVVVHEQPTCSEQNDLKHSLDAEAVSASVISDATVVIQTIEDVLQGVSQSSCYRENKKANQSEGCISVDQISGGDTSASANQDELPRKWSEQNVMAVSASVISDATLIIETIENMLQDIQHASNSEIVIKDQDRKLSSSWESSGSADQQGPNEINVCENQKQLSVNTLQDSPAVSEISSGLTNGDGAVIQLVEDMLQRVCRDADVNSTFTFEDKVPSGNENAENYKKSPCSADTCVEGGDEKSGKLPEQRDEVLSVVSHVVNDVIAVVQTMKDILRDLNDNGTSKISVSQHVSHGHEKGIVGNDSMRKVPVKTGFQNMSEIVQDCRVVVEDMCLKIESSYEASSSNLDQISLAKNTTSDAARDFSSGISNKPPNNIVLPENFIADSNVIFSADIVKLVREIISDVAARRDEICQNSNRIENEGTSSETVRSSFKNASAEKLLEKYSAESVAENILRSAVHNKQPEEDDLGASQNSSSLVKDIMSGIIKKVENMLRNSVSENSGSVEDTNADGDLSNNLYQTVTSVLNSVLKQVVDMPLCYAQKSVKNTSPEAGGNLVSECSNSSVASQDAFLQEGFEKSSLEQVGGQTEIPSTCDDQIDALSIAEDEEMEIDESQSVCSDDVSMEEEYSNIGSVDFVIVDEASCEMEDDCSSETKDSCVSNAENSSGVIETSDALNSQLSASELDDNCYNHLDMKTASTKELSFANVGANTNSQTSDVYVCEESNQLNDLSDEINQEKSLHSVDNNQVCPDIAPEGISQIELKEDSKKLNIDVVDLNCVKETLDNIIHHIADDKSFMYVPKCISGDRGSSVSDEGNRTNVSLSETVKCVEDTLESIVSFVSNSPPNVKDVSNDVPDETSVVSLETSEKPVVACSAAEQSSDLTAPSDSETDVVMCVKDTVKDMVSFVSSEPTDVFKKDTCSEADVMLCVEDTVKDMVSFVSSELTDVFKKDSCSEADVMLCVEDTVKDMVSFVSSELTDVFKKDSCSEADVMLCVEDTVKDMVSFVSSELTDVFKKDSCSEADVMLCVEDTVKDMVSFVSSEPTDVFEKDSCSEGVKSSTEICETNASDAALSEKVVAEPLSVGMTAKSEVEVDAETLQCVRETVQSVISLVSCTLKKETCTEMTESSESTITETSVARLQSSEEVVGSSEQPASNITSVDIEMGDSELCAIDTRKASEHGKRVRAVVETDASDAPPPKKQKMAPDNEEHKVLCDSNITSCQSHAIPETISDSVLGGEASNKQPVNNTNSVCLEILSSSSCSEKHLSDSVVSENKRPQDLCRHKETNRLDVLDKYESISKGHGLFFKDTDLHNLTRLSESETKRLKKSETMTPAIPDQYDLASVNTVKWNPNYGSHLWLFTGGQAGIARLSLVKALDSSIQTKTDSKFSKKQLQKR